MGSTILQLAMDAADDASISLQRPESLFPAGGDDQGDTTDRKLLRALTKTVKFLAASYDWQVLRKEKSFTTVAAETQTNAVPDDFLRFVMETFWDRSNRWPLNGPLSSSEWQTLKAQYSATVTPSYVQRGDAILVFPAPPAGNTYAFEYISTDIGKLAVGTKIARFTADTNTTLWDDELVILGMIWNYRSGAGLDYAQQYRDFERMMADRIKRDGGSRVIDMTGGSSMMTADERLESMKSNALVVPGP